MSQVIQRRNVGGRTNDDVRFARWDGTVIYQVYLKSFKDGNGDGVGDVAGLIEKLDYLVSLGVDAIWISPWFRSPMRDGGYDVQDYRSIDPIFGSMDEAEHLVEVCHERGLLVVLDLVANHCSIEHPWFVEALRSDGDSSARNRFYFRDGRGPDCELPPTDWLSIFGGPAWTRTANLDGTPGQWYLHLFDSSQPDFNWDCDDVRVEFDSILRFWFDRGVDGFRLDAIPALGKDADFRDAGFTDHIRFQPEFWPPQPFWDADGAHQVLKRWRGIAREYTPERFYLGEVTVGDSAQLARYLRHDEIHSVLTVDLAKLKWQASDFRCAIAAILRTAPGDGTWLTWTQGSPEKFTTHRNDSPRQSCTTPSQ